MLPCVWCDLTCAHHAQYTNTIAMADGLSLSCKLDRY